MDILIHTLSGCAVGGCIANWSNKSEKKGWIYFGIGAIAGAFPDIDAISLWSGFDSTIGPWLGLDESGRDIYSGKHWYSHHGFTHSLLWCLLAGLIAFFASRKSHRKWPITLTVFFGTLAHIVGDMPTPSGSWGGVAFFFPFDIYVGGWGKIWWWNNYDLFLILVFLNLSFAGLLFFRSRSRRLLSSVLMIFALAFFVRQVNTRGMSFNRSENDRSYPSFEQASKQIQRDILGTKLYKRMEAMDNAIPIYF